MNLGVALDLKVNKVDGLGSTVPTFSEMFLRLQPHTNRKQKTDSFWFWICLRAKTLQADSSRDLIPGSSTPPGI